MPVHHNPAALLGRVLLLSMVLAGSAQPAGADGAYEYDVKAAFVYHFTWYLQWPKTDAPEVFSIAVLGKSGIVAPLEEIARKKTVGGAPIVVRRCLDVSQIGRPRILFIARSASAQLPQVLEKIRGADVLTIGEEEGLGKRGVAVNFVERDGNIRFEVNEKLLKDSGIQIGSQLLKLAILVEADK